MSASLNFPPKALNISPQPVLITFKFPNIFSIASSVAPLSFKVLTTLFHWFDFKRSKSTLTPRPLGRSVTLGAPDIKASFNSFNVFVLACLFKGSNIGLTSPKTESIFLSNSLEVFCAKLISASLSPRCLISTLKKSSGLFPLDRNQPAILSIT